MLGKKQFDRAIPVARRLVDLRERAHGAVDPRVADALVGLARAQAGAGNTTEATVTYGKACTSEAATTAPPRPSSSARSGSASGRSGPTASRRRRC
jgi:hypothetical protein